MVLSETVGEISKYPPDGNSLTFNWEVPNCFAQFETVDPRIVSSPWFKAFTREWRLALIMSGGQSTESHLGFFLWKKAPSNEIPNVQVELMALNGVGNAYARCNGNLDLNGRFGSWNFVPLSTIFMQKEEISPAGFLTLRCIMENVPIILNVPGDSECSGTSEGESNQIDESNEDERTSENETSSDEEDGENKRHIAEDIGIKMLLENFRQLFIGGIMTDAVLKVDNREFKVHKAILAARSPVFASMFQHDLAEKKDNEVDIPDCTAESFEVFIHYIYCGSTDTMSTSNVHNVYYAADKYQVDGLKKKCVKFMKRNLSVKTFCDVIALSLRHGESRLQKTAVDFFCQNFREIIITSEWQKYLTENPIQGNELFIKASKGND